MHSVRIPGNIPVDIAAREVDDMEPTEVDSGRLGEEFRSFLAVESLNVGVAAGVLLHHLTDSSHGINSPIDDNSTDMHQRYSTADASSLLSMLSYFNTYF